jgi:hypothetical protein
MKLPLRTCETIRWIGVAVDIGERLAVGIQDLEAAVYSFNGPWCRESSHWPDRTYRKARPSP